MPKIQQAHSYETSVNFYQSTRRHTHTHRRDNLKSHLYRFVVGVGWGPQTLPLVSPEGTHTDLFYSGNSLRPHDGCLHSEHRVGLRARRVAQTFEACAGKARSSTRQYSICVRDASRASFHIPFGGMQSMNHRRLLRPSVPMTAMAPSLFPYPVGLHSVASIDLQLLNTCSV